MGPLLQFAREVVTVHSLPVSCRNLMDRPDANVNEPVERDRQGDRTRLGPASSDLSDRLLLGFYKVVPGALKTTCVSRTSQQGAGKSSAAIGK